MKAKILAIKLRAIGDTVIWTSALSQLRREWPDAEIHALTFATNQAVLHNHPAIDKLHLLSGKGRWELIKTLYSLRSQKYQWVMGFHATTSLCRWAWLAGGSRLALHHHSWMHTPKGSVTLSAPARLQDAISRDHQILEALGFSGPTLPTSLWLTNEEKKRAEDLVCQRIRACGGNEDKARLAFLPGAGHHLRRYPKDLWLPVVERVAKAGLQQPLVVIDRAVSEEWGLREECARLNVPLFDDGGLRDFMAVVSRAQAALANDSGPGHIAVALGLKTTFLFGPGCVGDWHCYELSRHPVLRASVSCRTEGPKNDERFQFCTVDVCEHHSCMRKIKFNQIIDVIGN